METLDGLMRDIEGAANEFNAKACAVEALIHKIERRLADAGVGVKTGEVLMGKIPFGSSARAVSAICFTKLDSYGWCIAYRQGRHRTVAPYKRLADASRSEKIRASVFIPDLLREIKSEVLSMHERVSQITVPELDSVWPKNTTD